MNNAGAILVIGRDWVIVPKMIHPVPPMSSSEDSSDINSWMQVNSSSTSSSEALSKLDQTSFFTLYIESIDQMKHVCGN